MACVQRILHCKWELFVFVKWWKWVCWEKADFLSSATDPLSLLPWRLPCRAAAPFCLCSDCAAACAGRFTGARLGAAAMYPGPGAPHKHGDGCDTEQNQLIQPDPESGHQPRGHSKRCSPAQQGDSQGNGAAGHAGSRYAQCGQYRFFHEFSPVHSCGSIPVSPL